ncbi:MAG: hypothetical protein HY778_03045 [Betaproteobacteria bacterium]|nr:hypothetical protein [Betaproteobacteria bacterium]
MPPPRLAPGLHRVATTTFNGYSSPEVVRTQQWDIRGRRERRADPDRGTWGHDYDAAGQLKVRPVG